MRLWMILGGLIGFSIGITLGTAQGSSWPGVLWRASVAAFLAGVVLRWWGGVWARSLQESQRERMLAADRDESTAKSRDGTKPRV